MKMAPLSRYGALLFLILTEDASAKAIPQLARSPPIQAIPIKRNFIDNAAYNYYPRQEVAPVITPATSLTTTPRDLGPLVNSLKKRLDIHKPVYDVIGCSSDPGYLQSFIDSVYTNQIPVWDPYGNLSNMVVCASGWWGQGVDYCVCPAYGCWGGMCQYQALLNANANVWSKIIKISCAPGPKSVHSPMEGGGVSLQVLKSVQTVRAVTQMLVNFVVETARVTILGTARDVVEAATADQVHIVAEMLVFPGMTNAV
ncbi:hypothetical protein TWF694_001453 [Orbilia ellipsospora]|uniref:Uncharacterized protein n=1 Tax=Orbilia ellipsospora TaxID=2528407 RepID=A0AAV9XSG8_9PEZI